MPEVMKLLFLSALLAAFPLSAPARPFTNQKGQTFDASLVSVDSTNAELMGKDGKKYKVALSTLSEADRKFCQDWLVANPALKLTVKTEGFAAKGTRQTNNDASSSGSDSVASRTTTDSDGDSSTATAAAVYRESMDGICLVIKHGSRIVATHTTGRVPKELQVEMMK